MHKSDGVVGTHCHKERDHSIDKRARRKLIFASILCLLFMIGEVVGKKRTLLFHLHHNGGEWSIAVLSSVHYFRMPNRFNLSL